MDQALELLEWGFYYDIPEEAYEAQSLEELVGLLGDPYAAYLTPEELQDTLNPTLHDVNAAGVGVAIVYTDQGMLVQSVVEGNSAQQAGIQPGDLIVAVDGVSCVPADSSCRSLVLGEEGTQVTLTILRDGVTRDYALTRRSIYVPSSQTTVLEEGAGYVSCTSFELETGGLFLSDLEEYDSQVDGWILDLRDNGGGFVDAALDMVAALNGPGYYIYEEYGDGTVAREASAGVAATEKPVVVLVNGGSASASELLTANIRDAERGISIGERTYGKGIGQGILTEDQFPGYFDGDALKFTTFRYYTGGGTSPHYIGVIPTLLVDSGRAQAVAAALFGGSEETSTLCVRLGGESYYVDPDADGAVLAELLSALPPQVAVFAGSSLEPCTPAQAAAELGLAYEDRWFGDAADSPYAGEINAVGTYRLMKGTAPGVFSPKEPLTRAQLCVILARALNVAYQGAGPFSDVAQDSWYGPSVNAVAALGLVNGVGGGRFDPDATLTQEEFLTILGRAARYLHVGLSQCADDLEDGEVTLSLSAQLALAPYSDWARSSVALLAWGPDYVLNGSGDLLYAPLDGIDPSATVLREEAAAGIYTVLARLNLLP